MSATALSGPFSAAKRIIAVILWACLLLVCIAPIGVSAGGKPLITTPDELVQAISDAQSGDVIYVGDIDFTPKIGISNELMRVKLQKSVTVKNGKKDGQAVFTNGCFDIQGGKCESERLICGFEGIVFDGGIDGEALTERDWELPYSEIEQEYTSDEPVKAQYAVSFRGNADVSFSECGLKNYMFGEGGALRCYYGDYSFDANLVAKLGDYTGCTLNILLEKCDVSDNSAYYGGGAVYIDGFNKNVTLEATDCSFTANRSAAVEYSTGGGAVYANNAKVILNRCTVKNNTANHLYSSQLPDSDTTQGGAIYCVESKLYLTDCLVAENTASVGGAIALINTEAEIDGCVIAGNKARFHASNPYGMTGPWSNMGLGGALYYSSVNVAAVTLVNTSIYANAAQNAYGGIYPFYNNEYEAALPHGFGSVSLLLCSYAGNTCDTQYDYTAEAFEWYQRPGDVWEIPYVKAYGCLIVDDTLDRDFAKYTTPVADNNYNYFASPRRAEADGLDVSVNAGGYGHYQPAAPENIAWSVPSDFAQGVLNGRYGGKTQKLHVGSNYSPALYPRADSADYTVIIIAGAVLLAAGIAALLILQGRRRIKERIQAEAEISVGAEPQAAGAATGEAAVDIPVFLNRFTYEQIDEVLAAMPEAARLTTREREVVREILSGKQQLEIAHELGIEVTTVKDFNRKIYDKFNVANKKKLLEKVGMLYHGQ